MSAVLSICRRYRYALWRDTELLGGDGTVLFVGLNPSRADESANDPTVTRCIRFARDWGYATMALGNLYAWRTAYPKFLRTIPDRVGPENDVWLERLVAEADLVVAAWGAAEVIENDREAEVLAIVGTCSCLGKTQAGRPRHPLYLPSTTVPESFCTRSQAA